MWFSTFFEKPFVNRVNRLMLIRIARVIDLELGLQALELLFAALLTFAGETRRARAACALAKHEPACARGLRR